MDADALWTLHRYGAVGSLLATLGAAVAVAVGGPLTPLQFPLGFFGPLAACYFVGAVLEADPAHRVLGEELLRGVVWYGASLLGWALVLSSTDAIPATAATALGLPAATALGMTLVMVAVRRLTGLELKVQHPGGQLLVVVTGAFVGGFLVLYAVLAAGGSPWLVPLYLLATAGGLLGWHRYWRRADADG